MWMRCLHSAPVLEASLWAVFLVKDLYHKDQNTVLGVCLASVPTASLYSWLLIFGEPFANTHFLLSGNPEPRRDVLLIGL